MSEFDWGQILAYGPTTVLLALLLIALLKLAPTWKEVRLKELDLRKSENDTRAKEAESIGQLASAQIQLSEVIKDIAIEQRRATETVEILQRVNADSSDKLATNVQFLNERIERVEQARQNDMLSVTRELSSRLEKIEQHVDAQTARA